MWGGHQERKEDELRALAQRARLERSGGNHTGGGAAHNSVPLAPPTSYPPPPPVGGGQALPGPPPLPAGMAAGMERERGRGGTAMQKWRIVRLGFGMARQKTLLERWTSPKPLQNIWYRAAI
jgi:hypothetical protein